MTSIDPSAPPRIAAPLKAPVREPAPAPNPVSSVMGVLWRAKWTVLAAGLLAVALAKLIVTQIPPRYIAVAEVLLEPAAASAAAPLDEQAVRSEIRVMMSPGMLEQVVDTLRLEEDDSLRRIGWPSVAFDRALAWLEPRIGWRGRAPEMSTGREALRQSAVEALSAGLSVDRIERSRVVAIRFEAAAPRTASLIANAVADQYIAGLQAARRNAARDAAQILREELTAQDQRVREAERDPTASAADLEAARRLREVYLKRLETGEALSGFAAPVARVVARATPPRDSAWPDEALILITSALAGLAIGAAAVILRDAARGGLRSASDVERMTGLPLLAVSPVTPGWRGDPVDRARKRPGSRLAEAARDLRCAFALNGDAPPPKLVAVVSAAAGEGKSTIAALLAESCARMGQRVLLIDGDIRNPAQAKRYGISGSADLLSVLDRSASLADAVQRMPGGRLYVLPSQSATARSADALAGRDFSELLAAMRDKFDLVVVDTPPTLAVADARMIAAQSDATLLVIRWAETGRDDVGVALRGLRAAGANVIGAVLSRAEVDPHSVLGAEAGNGRYERFADYFVE